MSEAQVCTFCVMDTSAPDISFDASGRCNYCREFEAALAKPPSDAATPAAREAFVAEVKRRGAGKEYDCIVGVSGGVDSSYALFEAVRLGLRPLAVHLDNGWNSELASHNIASLVSSLNVDLFTHVIDWRENRDLQRSLFAADVIDIEMLMDSAMLELNFSLARKYGLKFILSGSNSATEGMKMPPHWNHNKWDARNVKRIHAKFGKLPIRTHLLYSTTKLLLDRYVRKIQWVPFLDYFDYNKNDALEILKRECDYRPYAHKHYESVFTRFYQAYILPIKFGVDKRRLHLSSLIVSKQETRDNALATIAGDPYPDLDQKREDRTFVLKKLGFSDAEFDTYLRRPPISHEHYGSEAWIMESLRRLRAVTRAEAKQTA